MLDTSTALRGFVSVIADGLRDEYGIDPAPLLDELGISLRDTSRPGSRIEVRKLREMWQRAYELTGDPDVGLKIGRGCGPEDFYVLGHSWFASETLGDALARFVRYNNIINTIPAPMSLDRENGVYRLSRSYSDIEDRPPEIVADAGYAALLTLCESVKERPVRVQRVERIEAESIHPGAFEALVGCPVTWGNEEAAMYFAAEEIEAPLHFAIPDVAEATDRIAERYLESLDQNMVATQVRRLLIQMLPSGAADQESVASMMHRSTSTLQRQLSAEETSYRQVLEATRRSMAREYLRKGEHSQAHVAYLLGFSDQSNFGRAFRRWTGKSPGQYQKEHA